MNTTAFTIDQLLAIPPNRPDLLFSANKEETAQQFRALMKRWHPDRCALAQAGVVTAHIAALYAEQKRQQKWPSHRPDGATLFRALDGRDYRFATRQQWRFELGQAHLARGRLAFQLQPKARDLLNRSQRLARTLPMADTAMARQMEGLLPCPEMVLETIDGPVLVMKKSPGLVRLLDLLRHHDGALAPAHVAWIMSGLYHLVCYLEQAGLSHNGLWLDSVFVDPRDHAVALPGGWWYASPLDAPLKALPRQTLARGPADLTERPVGRIETDLALAKAIGHELLGLTGLQGPTRRKATPAPLLLWLTLPAGASALTEYEGWQQVLTDSFGHRRFVPLTDDFDAIYPESAPSTGPDSDRSPPHNLNKGD